MPPLLPISGVRPDAASPVRRSHARTVEAFDVLLVEDETSLRDLLSHWLEQAGYTVLAVAHGRAALQCLNTHRVRLVLTDLFMPETDGFELLQRLRTMPRPPPVIAMSGCAMVEVELFLKVARLLGARQALVKPFRMRPFLGAVADAIGARGSAEIPTASRANS